MQATHAYIAGMQYTLRNIPPALDQALRDRAKRDGTSLNEAAITALARALGLDAKPVRVRSLVDLAGTWQDDPEFDEVIQDQHSIDRDLWR
jgi:plasmid stability protein